MHFDTPHNPLNNSGVVGPRRSRRAGGPGARTGLPRAISRSVAVLAILLWALAARGEHYALPLLVTPGTSGDPQGMLRILNGTAESGTVEIYAIDDAGTRTGPATFTLNASAAAEFTATDLQSGNATLGLSGGIGTDVGDARLLIDTDLEIVPLALVRAADGTLSAMHDTVRAASTDGSGQYAYEVPVFNPSTEMSQVSRLRLINPGDAAAAVTIGARDDSGAAATGGDVTLTLAGGGAKTLTVQQLEAGDSSVTGRLGAGTGKWRLSVSSDRPLQVVNIVASSAGDWNNLSTTAVAGAAPANLAAFNERFLGESLVHVTSTGRYTLDAMAGQRFTQTSEADGVTSTDTGSYSYEAIGPDAGRLALTYDLGLECDGNYYFSHRTSGWFAANCIGGDRPHGSWSGGQWFVADEADNGGAVETTHGVGDTLPGVPTSGAFVPSMTSGATVTSAADGTTVALDDGGYFELDDGTRYTCTAADGCTIVNGAVTAGSLTARTPVAPEVDRFPTFRNATGPGDQAYTLGTAIAALTLPEAEGGNGTLTYALSPDVPGLSFDAAARRLTGAPSTAGRYAMTYTATDEDGDTDTLGFTVAVSESSATEGLLGNCHVSLLLSAGQSCAYPGTAERFSVNARGRGSFLGRLAGIRIRINNQTVEDRVYDFEASHQGDGVWRIDRIAGSTETPDRAELVALYNATDGANWAQGTNWLSSAPLSQWHGVEVDGNGRVRALRLSRNQLSGSIPAELGRLSRLSDLSLQSNQLSGSIPAELGALSSLTILNLDTNQLSGPIPAELGQLSNLVVLRLNDNRLSGPVPAELGGLSNLSVLWLSGNQLSGSIPAELVRLSRLSDLSLNSNQLSGSIPVELGALSSLTVLNLYTNQLSGPIPAELGRLSNLEVLRLNDNRLSGPIPAELGRLSNLSILWLSGNQLSGSILAELGRLSRLSDLSLQSNQLSGSIPVELGALSSLTVLNLFTNQLSGPIPAELAQLTNLEVLRLNDNRLSGPIPAELGQLSNLEILGLNDNRLSGPIPAELGQLSNLLLLWLERNQLSGPIPAELGGLSRLAVLNLFTNQLSGPIPAELGQLTNLELLGLNDNQLSGSIPIELGALAKLMQVYLGGNELTGCIPGGLRDVPTNDLSGLGLPFC